MTLCPVLFISAWLFPPGSLPFFMLCVLHYNKISAHFFSQQAALLKTLHTVVLFSHLLFSSKPTALSLLLTTLNLCWQHPHWSLHTPCIPCHPSVYSWLSAGERIYLFSLRKSCFFGSKIGIWQKTSRISCSQETDKQVNKQTHTNFFFSGILNVLFSFVYSIPKLQQNH